MVIEVVIVVIVVLRVRMSVKVSSGHVHVLVSVRGDLLCGEHAFQLGRAEVQTVVELRERFLDLVSELQLTSGQKNNEINFCFKKKNQTSQHMFYGHAQILCGHTLACLEPRIIKT